MSRAGDAILQKILATVNGIKGPDDGGWYTALCPFHADHNRPNLRLNTNGFRCLACGASGSLTILAQRLGLSVDDPFEQRIEAAYDYRDEQGHLLFQVVRLHSPKDFRQRRPDRSGGWIWNLRGIRRVLYRLPELIAADPSAVRFIVEGEKDADGLASAGLVGTTNPMGASRWRSEYNESLRGRRVVILPDNDPEGRRHADKVALSLHGTASEVRILALPGLPPKGDVTDWLEAGGTEEELLRLADQAPTWRLEANTSPRDDLATFTASELMAMEIAEPRWAVPEILPDGLSVLSGKPKMGKSWFALAIALAIASGGVALGSVRVQGGHVLYLALEDTKRRLQDRLQKLLGMSPAPETLTLATAWQRTDRGGLEAIEAWLASHPDARLVVIDSFKKIRPGRGRGASLYDEDYEAIEGLKAVADKFGVAILVIHHLRKLDAEDPVDTVSGTLGLTGAADGILVLMRQRGRADATLFITGRDVDEQELALSWDGQIAAWSIVGEAEDFRLSEERSQAIRVLRDADRPLSPSEAAPLLGKTPGATKKLLWTMAQDGQIVSSGGRYSIPSNHGNPVLPSASPVTRVTEDECGNDQYCIRCGEERSRHDEASPHCQPHWAHRSPDQPASPAAEPPSPASIHSRGAVA